MILQGNEDLRIRKTIQGIKSAFEELICEKEYEKITVRELCDKAQINKRPSITTMKPWMPCFPNCRANWRKGI